MPQQGREGLAPYPLYFISAQRTPQTAQILAQNFQKFFEYEDDEQKISKRHSRISQAIQHFVHDPHSSYYTRQWLLFSRMGMNPNYWPWSLAQAAFTVVLTSTTSVVASSILGGVTLGPIGIAQGVVTGAANGVATSAIFLVADEVCHQSQGIHQNHTASHFNAEEIQEEMKNFFHTGELNTTFKYLTALSYQKIMRYFFWASMMIRNKRKHFGRSKQDIDDLFKLAYAHKKMMRHPFRKHFTTHFFELFTLINLKLEKHQISLYKLFQRVTAKPHAESHPVFVNSVATHVVKSKIAHSQSFAQRIANDFICEFVGQLSQYPTTTIEEIDLSPNPIPASELEFAYRQIFNSQTEVRKRGERVVTVFGTVRQVAQHYFKSEKTHDSEKSSMDSHSGLFSKLSPQAHPKTTATLTKLVSKVCSLFTVISRFGYNHEFKKNLELFDENFQLCTVSKPSPHDPSLQNDVLALLLRMPDGQLIYFDDLTDGSRKNYLIRQFSHSGDLPLLFQVMYRYLIEDMQELCQKMKIQEHALRGRATKDIPAELLSEYFLSNCVTLLSIIQRLYYVRGFLEFFEHEAGVTRQLFLTQIEKIANELATQYDSQLRAPTTSLNIHSTDAALHKLRVCMSEMHVS